MKYILGALVYALSAFEIILIARVLVSWLRLGDHPIVGFLHAITEPVLRPIRTLIDKSIFGGRKGGMILDISPLIAFMIISLIQQFINTYLAYGY